MCKRTHSRRSDKIRCPLHEFAVSGQPDMIAFERIFSFLKNLSLSKSSNSMNRKVIRIGIWRTRIPTTSSVTECQCCRTTHRALYRKSLCAWARADKGWYGQSRVFRVCACVSLASDEVLHTADKRLSIQTSAVTVLRFAARHPGLIRRLSMQHESPWPR